MLIPNTNELLAILETQPASERFKQIIENLTSLSTVDSKLIKHEPMEEDVTNGDVEYFCCYDFTDLGIFIDLTLDKVEYITFNSSINVYGKYQISYNSMVFDINLDKYNRYQENGFLGSPIKSFENADIFIHDNLEIKIGFCFDKNDVLSYVRVGKLSD